MNHYHWEQSSRERPWYLKAWFLVPVIMVTLGCATALVGYAYLYSRFAAQVKEYDLSKLEKMEAASVIYDRNGIPMGKIFIQNRLPISYSEIPENMVRAIIAEEDNRFFEHHGVDYFGVLRAAISNYRQGRIKQGASTVTQQLARNSFELKERSFRRKILEMFLAHRIERSLSKEKIMELYLNRVYFGSGFYGIEAAAVGYFGKSAKELSVGDCAMLAGLLKSPNGLSPWNNPKGAIKVRDFVLARMNEMHFLNAQELQAALKSTLGVHKRTNPFKVSYAIDLVRQQAIAALGFERAMNGGVRIDTTFDSKLQQNAENSLHQELDKIEQTKGYNHETYADYHEHNSRFEEAIARGERIALPTPSYLQGAVLTIDNQSGGILALVGGRNFMHSEYNRALQGRRPPGTLFTPFVAAAAYSKGIFPGEIVEDACIDNHYVMIGGDTGILGEWGVERADNSYEGPLTSHEAVARGKNAAVVRLGFKTGTDAIKQLSSQAGIRSPLREVANAYLGTSEMELDELTLAFSIFPGEGSRPERLYTITKITDADGKVVFENSPKRVKVISPEVAFQAHYVLDDALHKTNEAEVKQYGLGFFPAAGKSGTAYDFTDAWFIGYSSAITCGVWIGFDKPQQIYRGAFGKNLALPVWCSVMNDSIQNFKPQPITAPETLHPVEISRTTGLLADSTSEGKANRAFSKLTSAEEVQGADCTAKALAAEVKFPKNSNFYTEYATASQLSEITNNDFGADIRKAEKNIDDEGWPRAASVTDLTKVKPIIVTAPTLLVSSDVYRFVNVYKPPVRGDENIPVRKAIPVNRTQKEPEVRRAEAVRPMDLPTGAPVISIPPPNPMSFQDED
ncbi:MAG TPA: transglycosylase domain-containing protein [Chthoniobacterales bacterium]|nr:transglycosylase domain-containing protein [Chthoniobacterales bacterium]